MRSPAYASTVPSHPQTASCLHYARVPCARVVVRAATLCTELAAQSLLHRACCTELAALKTAAAAQDTSFLPAGRAFLPAGRPRPLSFPCTSPGGNSEHQ